ncbi:cell division protein ZapA [Rhodomicrobium lacus]|jgi:cell division protein ZapA|uniref:cell division protein ZapA n=1 Tax=Rhodomicrobium TaxID=1068 RepID=UPI000F8DBAC4|nr:cell division protein ZapA [Rhodomicrobium lacus]WKW52290.1 cell division protein ZapA [Rhodomicrobium lacus]
MAQVSVLVNGRSFKLACRDGEESRVQELAAQIDALIQKFKGNSRAAQDDRLFLMAALLLADQLSEAQAELQRTRQPVDSRAYQVIEGGAHAMQRDLSRALEAAAARVEPLPRISNGS